MDSDVLNTIYISSFLFYLHLRNVLAFTPIHLPIVRKWEPNMNIMSVWFLSSFCCRVAAFQVTKTKVFSLYFYWSSMYLHFLVSERKALNSGTNQPSKKYVLQYFSNDSCISLLLFFNRCRFTIELTAPIPLTHTNAHNFFISM